MLEDLLSLSYQEEIVEYCEACDLYMHRDNIVYGVGPDYADIMLVGEAPGAEEDRTGIPFVGQAGRVLDQALETAGIHRDDVYITNIVKCRPPKNRNPSPEEIAICLPFLTTQIELVDPRVVVALGRYASNVLVGRGPMRNLNASVHYKHGRVYYCMYHPAAALYTPAILFHIVEAMKYVPRLVEEHRELDFSPFY